MNEIIKARKELGLEESSKIADADQSLRDTLKTFGMLKSRISS